MPDCPFKDRHYWWLPPFPSLSVSRFCKAHEGVGSVQLSIGPTRIESHQRDMTHGTQTKKSTEPRRSCLKFTITNPHNGQIQTPLMWEVPSNLTPCGETQLIRSQDVGHVKAIIVSHINAGQHQVNVTLSSCNLLSQVTSLVGWPKLVKFVFFFFTCIHMCAPHMHSLPR